MFIACLRKYSQSEYRKAIVYLTVLHPTIVHHSFVTLIVLAIVFSMAWYKIVMQCSLVVYHGISHLSLVISWYIHVAIKQNTRLIIGN